MVRSGFIPKRAMALVLSPMKKWSFTLSSSLMLSGVISTRATSIPRAGTTLTQAALSCTDRIWALKLRLPSGIVSSTAALAE